MWATLETLSARSGPEQAILDELEPLDLGQETTGDPIERVRVRAANQHSPAVRWLPERIGRLEMLLAAHFERPIALVIETPKPRSTEDDAATTLNGGFDEAAMERVRRDPIVREALDLFGGRIQGVRPRVRPKTESDGEEQMNKKGSTDDV